MFPKYEAMTLSTIGGGQAIALFDHELTAVLENIMDVNTDSKKVREINLKLKIKPNDDRDQAVCLIEVTSKKASAKGVGTFVYIGRQQGVVMAIEQNPKQGILFDPGESQAEDADSKADKRKPS